MKRLIFSLLLFVAAMGAKAQFERGTKVVDVSFTGLQMGYSNGQKLSIGVEGLMGYFVEDSWMIYCNLGYSHHNKYNNLQLGSGGRYYIQQNGIYVGLGCMYEHTNPNYNNIFVTPHIGYAFYLNRYLTVEPAVYYNISLNDLEQGSRFGLQVGFGYYF